MVMMVGTSNKGSVIIVLTDADATDMMHDRLVRLADQEGDRFIAVAIAADQAEAERQLRSLVNQ
jgi:acetaldehyde dehydrogenase (acetylating)